MKLSISIKAVIRLLKYSLRAASVTCRIPTFDFSQRVIPNTLRPSKENRYIVLLQYRIFYPISRPVFRKSRNHRASGSIYWIICWCRDRIPRYECPSAWVVQPHGRWRAAIRRAKSAALMISTAVVSIWDKVRVEK